MVKSKQISTVKEGAYMLPEWLYEQISIKEQIDSPAAMFDVSAAFSGNPWQCSTTPSSELKKKTIVLTVSIFGKQHNTHQWLALIHWLELLGFTIYLCTQDVGSEKVTFLPAAALKASPDKKKLFNALSRLTSFEEEADYETLSQEYHLQQDNIAVIDNNNTDQFFSCLSNPITYVQDLENDSAIKRIERDGFMGYVSLAEPPLIKRNPISIAASLAEALRQSPDQEDFLIENRLRNKKLQKTLVECIQLMPDKINKLVKQFLKNRDFATTLDDPFSSDFLPNLDLALKKEVINYLMQNENEKFISSSLAAFIIHLVPAHAQTLMERDAFWPMIIEDTPRAIFFQIYAHRFDELLAEYANRLIDGDDLADLLHACPEKAEELLKKYGHLIRKKTELLKCMQAAPSYAKDLFDKNQAWISSKIAEAFPAMVAEYLMADESRITKGYQMAVCIEQYPEQQKRLLLKHAFKVNGLTDLKFCCRILTNFDDLKPILAAQIGKEKPTKLLTTVATFQPRLFYWMAECLKNVDIFQSRTHIDFFLHGAPERLEWLLQYDPAFTPRYPSERRKKYFLNDRDPSPYNLGTSFLKVKEAPVSDVTYLYVINSVNILSLTNMIKEGKMLHIVVLELAFLHPDEKTENLGLFLEALEQYCPHLQHLLLPEAFALRQLAVKWPVTYQSSQFPYAKFKREKKAAASQPSAKIHIADNGLQTQVNSDDKNSAFHMVEVGELLNRRGQELPRIRTGIVELSSNFSQQDYFKATLTKIPTPPKLDTNIIDNYRQASVEDCYCRFTVQLSKGKATRLPSVDAQETVMGIIAKELPDPSLQFYRGDDGFYYVKSSQNRSLDYVIKADSVETQAKKLAAIPINNTIMELVNQYRHLPDKGELMHPMPKGNKEPWLEKLFECRSGACRHRCYALWYAIVSKDPFLKKHVRLVVIDNNHMRLEIHDVKDNTWHQVDLGGTEAKLLYDDKVAAIYKPGAVTETPRIPEEKVIRSHSPNPPESAVNDPVAGLESSHQLARELNRQKKYKHLYQLDNIKDKVFRDSTPSSAIINTLIVNKDVQTQAMIILEQARLGKRPIFYLDKPGQYGTGKEQISLFPEGEPVISKKDALDAFIELIQDEPNALLMINWDAFSPQQRVALNTVIDRQRSLYGKTLPNGLSVISLCSETPKDRSFSSRHKKKYISNLTTTTTKLPALESTRKTIDVQGYPNWQSFLFGAISMDNDNNSRLVWNQGPLARLLMKGKEKESAKTLIIDIKNLPTEAEADFLNMIRQAKAQGYIEYYGYKMAIPDSIVIAQNTVPFTFSHFPTVEVCDNISVDKTPESSLLINTTLFDYLLRDKEINHGKYHQLPGLIEINQGKELPLFIQSTLSVSQWYCLFAEAEKNKVKLVLYLAPGVTIPMDLPTEARVAPDTRRIVPQNIHVTNNAKAYAFGLSEKSDALCLAIEDYGYQDLVGRIDYQYDENLGFHDFNDQKSDLINALENGRDVIIYGQSGKALLQALAPQLLRTWPGKLTLVIEDKLLQSDQLQQPYLPLSWLPQDAYTLAVSEAILPKPGLVFEEKTEVIKLPLDLTNSEENANEFIKARVDLFLECIASHPKLQMIGHTAVGKSNLIEEIKKIKKGLIRVYHELKQFEEWATDLSDELKILFIDESNIENQHFTLFDALTGGGTDTILYKGKLYPLTDKHRVVFARNPHDYGGGRSSQKLFADGSIPELHLKDMPPAFIYERMLRPIYHATPIGTEEVFKQKAMGCLTRFVQQKNVDPSSVSVRALQEEVLNEHLLPTMDPISKEDAHSKNKHYIPTPSTRILRQSLKNFIQIHQQAPVGIGLNCFYLEGNPGMGKSELIAHILNRMHYYPQGKHHQETQSKRFIKIDASLHLTQKKSQLIEAIENGWLVWMDEGNTCMDDGLEKFLNSALSGIHPLTGKRIERPGFMLILTANSIAMEGRSAISPALRARSVNNSLPDITCQDLRIIVKKTLSDQLLAKTDWTRMAADLDREFKRDKTLTLREITGKLEHLAASYPLSLSGLQARLEEAAGTNDATNQMALLLINNGFVDKDASTIYKIILPQAAQQGNLELIQLLLDKNPLVDPTLLKIAINNATRNNHKEVQCLLEKNLVPQEYYKIWTSVPTLKDKGKEKFEQARALLRDYTKNDSLFGRISHFHWNRNHVKEINKALVEATDLDTLRQKLGDIELKNKQGSLARRIQYINRMCPNSPDSIKDYSAKSTPSLST